MKVKHSVRAHSKKGASIVERWSNCPGSVQLCETVPHAPSSPAAEEGTKAHEYAEIWLRTRLKPTMTEEMAPHVETYVSYVLNLPGTKLIETKFDLNKIAPDLYGTCDAVVMDVNSATLHVVDLKFGSGVPVEVKDNKQLKYYGLGALLRTAFPCDWVNLTIVQPRCPHPDGPIRSHKISSMEMLDFAADLKMWADAADEDNAPLVPGSHCRFCPAAGVCDALRKEAMATAQTEFGKGQTLPVSGGYDPVKLADILGKLDRLEEWAKSVRNFAYAEASRGVALPGYKLVAKRAMRKWTDEEKAAEWLKNRRPQQAHEFFDMSLKSIAQVEKIIPKTDQKDIQKFVVQMSSGNVLVSSDDPRPEVKILDASEEFTKVIEEVKQLTESEKTDGKHNHPEVPSLLPESVQAQAQ